MVFEREVGVDVRPRDWTILVHWAMPILTQLLSAEVLAELPQAVCNPHLDFTPDVETLPCYNGATGDILFRSPTPGARRITRQKLRRVLLDGVDVRWGKNLARLSAADHGAAVELAFDDGDSYEADFVLGADGPSSKVRELLVGPEAAKPSASGLMFATGIVKYRDAAKADLLIKAHPVAAIVMGREATGGCGGMLICLPSCYFSSH